MNSSSTMYHYYYYIWIDDDVDVCGGSWVIVHSTHKENNISSRSYFFRCFHSFSHSFLFNFLPPQCNERNTLEKKLQSLQFMHIKMFEVEAFLLRDCILYLRIFFSHRLSHTESIFRLFFALSLTTIIIC